jgi:uncharacterized repeat protein (TIGR01451 family)
MKYFYILLVAVVVSFTARATTCGTNAFVLQPVTCAGDSNGIAILAPATIGTPYTLTLNGAVSQFYGFDSLYGLSAGTYIYLVMDSVSGCMDSGTFVITEPPPILVLLSNDTMVACNGGFAYTNVTVVGGTAPFTYLWSNGSTTPFQQGLAAGTYLVLVTDANGCSATGTFTVSQPPPIISTFTVTPPSCNTCSDGSITAITTGGATPYVYNWNGVPGISSVLNGVPVGVYQLCVTDAMGCTHCDSVFCYGPSFHRLSGRIYYDLNGNGMLDSIEPGAGSKHVWIAPDSISAYSRASDGAYVVYLTNGTYLDSLVSDLGWHTTTPTSLPVSISGADVTGFDFGIAPDNPAVPMVTMTLSPPLPRCNTDRMYSITIGNLGWQAANGIVYFQADPSQGFVSASPVPDSIVGSYYYWHFNALQFGQHFNYYITFNLPGQGTLMNMYANASAFDTSGTMVSFQDYGLQQLVSCSYDPNDKSVSPIDNGTATGVMIGNPLNYTIRFQNTGTDTAFTVVIRDTISAIMDLSTFEITGSSHPVQTTLTASGLLTFTFDNILLPDSNVDEPGSHGYVSYRLNHQPNISPGTTVDNTAYIYFDANAAVVTNTTHTVFTNVVINVPDLVNPLNFDVYPNPISSDATLQFSKSATNGYKVTVVNLMGGIVRDLGVITEERVVLNRKGIASGCYLLKVMDTANGTTSLKRIIFN